MKKLAFVGTSSRMSGVEFSTLYLVRALDRSKWEPIVVCPEEGDLPARAKAAGVSVSIIPISRLFGTSFRFARYTLINPLGFLGNLGTFFVNALRLRRFLLQSQIDLVVTKGMHAHFFGGMAARLAGVPCIWHVQDRVSERYGVLFPWILSVSCRFLARQVIADAESIARQLRSFVPPDRIHVVWNGIDTEQFSPAVDGSHVRAEWGAAKDQVLLGVVARLTPWKGQHLLLEALASCTAEFPNAKVVLVGSPLFDTESYLRRLREDVLRLKIRESVIFAGFRWDLPQVLAALDVVVHTSVEKDSSPLAVVSAMAAGKPIVCARVDGTADLFHDGVDGMLFEPNDVTGLVRTLRPLLSDRNLRCRLGDAARRTALECLSIEQFTRHCEKIFRTCLN